MDSGGDLDQIMVGDFDDLTDSIVFGDKDIRDGTHTSDKDGRDPIR